MRTGTKVGTGGLALAIVVGLVVTHEGYVPRTYKDPIGILTSCYGHVSAINTPGREFTRQECEALLEADLSEANAIVHRCINASMLPHQEAALTSFAYNVGPGKAGVKDGLCVLKNGNQPRIRRFANAGNWTAACAEFPNWTRAGGKQLPGLVKRRAAERALCEGRK